MASEQWQQVTVGDVSRVTSGKRPSVCSETPAGNPIPVYGGAGIMGWTKEALFAEPILVTGRVGTLGVINSTQGPSWPSDNTLVIVPNMSRVNHDFLYYGLALTIGRLVAYNRGTSNPLIVQRDVKMLPLPLPPIPVQERIAHILGMLDDKIELNRRMSRTLERIAAAIFKSWFIDFDPVRAKATGDPTAGGLPAEIADLFPDSFEDSELGPIPKGWEVRPLDEIADYLNGLPCQKHPPVEGQKSLPVIKIRELRQGITSNSDRATVDVPPKYIVEDGDILFSWSGSLLVTIWCGGRSVLNQHVFKVTSEVYPKWFFYRATKHHLEAFQRIASDKATTMGHIKRHHLADAKVAVPSEALMQKCNKVLGTMLDRRINALKQARILAITRDTLLPKLLSGEIDVSAFESLAEEMT